MVVVEIRLWCCQPGLDCTSSIAHPGSLLSIRIFSTLKDVDECSGFHIDFRQTTDDDLNAGFRRLGAPLGRTCS